MTPRELADRLRLASMAVAVVRMLLPPSEVSAEGDAGTGMDEIGAVVALGRAEEWLAKAHSGLVDRIAELDAAMTPEDVLARVEVMASMLGVVQLLLSEDEFAALFDRDPWSASVIAWDGLDHAVSLFDGVAAEVRGRLGIDVDRD